MSKYIIEIEDKPFVRLSALFREEGLYRAKGFNSLVFDQFGLDKLTPLDKELEEAYQKGYEVGQHEATTLEYQQGLDDAWEGAKKALHYNDYQREVVFDEDNFYKIMEEHSASEALAKLKAYEQQKAYEIKVGDEVRNTLGLMDNAVGYVIGTTIEGDYNVSRYIDGKIKTGTWRRENCVKTGKHSDAIVQLLAEMEGGAE